MISQFCKLRLGIPCVTTPTSKRISEPTPILTTVTAKGLRSADLFTERPSKLALELASTPITAIARPICFSRGNPAGSKKSSAPSK